MVIYHIDMVILDVDMGYGLMVCEMIVSIWSSSTSTWDALSLWPWKEGYENCHLKVNTRASKGHRCDMHTDVDRAWRIVQL
jgi:hypothetical protein